MLAKRCAFSVLLALAACSDSNPGTQNNSHLPEAGGMCGTMTCSGTQMCCGAVCSDVATDPNNCGGCGSVCPVGSRADACANGTCQCNGGAVCATTESCCSGTGCKDLSSDTQNCGMCGHACGSGQACESGNCVTILCNGQPCDHLCCNNQCVDISMDDNNCGMCGHACNVANGESCHPIAGGLGQCEVICGGVMCMMGQGCCAGQCTYLQFDDNNCGQCGNACDVNSGAFCLNGQCCTDFNTCLGLPDGGFPFPDGGFPFPPDASVIRDGGAPD